MTNDTTDPTADAIVPRDPEPFIPAEPEPVPEPIAAAPAEETPPVEAAPVEAEPEPVEAIPALIIAREPEPFVPAEPEAVAQPGPEPEPVPLRFYEYRFIRVRQNTWDEAERAILSQGAEAVAKAGGQLYGVWAGQIGLSANQGIVVTAWTDLQAAKRSGGEAIAGIGAVSTSEALYMEPTTRPSDPTPPEGPGVFAHRIFEVRRDDANRFIELSDYAWPQFEYVFGTRVYALWRETGHDRAMDRLILLTRYNDYAAWEASRYWRPDPNPTATEALERFRERRAITVDTVVYTTRLATPAAG
jgi:hypothetical protein